MYLYCIVTVLTDNNSGAVVLQTSTVDNLVIMSGEECASGTSRDSPKQYTELTPVTWLNSDYEITDVKVPYTSLSQLSENDIPNAQRPPILLQTLENNVSNSQQPDSQEEMYPTPPEMEISQLMVLYRGLPKEMFINRILVQYASCEVKLENARFNILERLKDMEDFPYGLQCELKRRLHTRTGESVPTKLAYDIHTLLSVVDGADYSDIKDLLSNG